MTTALVSDMFILSKKASFVMSTNDCATGAYVSTDGAKVEIMRQLKLASSKKRIAQCHFSFNSLSSCLPATAGLF